MNILPRARVLILKKLHELNLFEPIKKDIENRDHQDMTREISPLRQAEDAVLVDSSLMNIDEVVAAILGIYKDKVE